MERWLKRSLYKKEKIDIIYLSKSNELTKRTIRVIQFNEDRILAYCYLKERLRLFSVENILAVELTRNHYGA
ncbi:hypothetical protein [Oceanobacillus senegalensis]|uniref:hypothetical protein n=1 Tax=Oceanobacillus senegalensis TaxID=1936063 RepID=UPI000A30B7C0|nr:hypothetical protein [Oceanobacillus senegalensis]